MSESTGPRAVSLALRLKQVEHALRLRLQPHLDAAGLTAEHWQVLSLLLARPGLPMSTIAEAAVLAPATLTRHMDRLVAQAMVVRRIDPDDRRRVVAALSPLGEQVARRLREEELRIEEALVEQLGPLPYSVMLP